MRRILKPITYATLFMVTAISATMSSMRYALAQATTSDSADVGGALQQNQDGRDAVEASKVSEEGFQSGFSSIANVVMYGAGAAGIAMVVAGVYMVYKANKEGEHSRHSPFAGWVMMGVGGLMTIPAIIAAFIPELLLDGV